jgi:hypothetical protein
MKYYKIDFTGADTYYVVFVSAVNFGAADKLAHKILMADENVILSVIKEISYSEWVMAMDWN